MSQDYNQAPPPVALKTDAETGNKAQSKRRLLFGGAGLVVAAAIGLAVIGHGGAKPQLSIVPQAQIAALSQTLDPAKATAMAYDAEACKVPLAKFLMWHNPSVADSDVRIQAGNYISPPFRLTTTPQMIAIPFPNGYASGAGDITVLGVSPAINLTLNPGIYSVNVNGSLPIHLYWTPGNPCQ